MMYCTAIMSYVNAVLLGTYPLKYLAYFYSSAAILYLVATASTAHYFTYHPKKALTIGLFFCIAIILCTWQWGDSIRLSRWYPFAFCVFLLASGKFLMQAYWNIASDLLHIRDFKSNSNILGAAIALAGISMGVLGPFIIKEYNVIGLLPAMGVFLLINLILLYAIAMTDDVVKPTAPVMQRFHNQYPLQKFLIYFALVALIFSTLVDYLFKYQVSVSFALYISSFSGAFLYQKGFAALWIINIYFASSYINNNNCFSGRIQNKFTHD
jgi:hypothetical protein